MTEKVKFKLNLREGEIEIEGGENFVSTQIDRLAEILDLVGTKQLVVAQKEPKSENDTENPIVTKNEETPKIFGEWLQQFKSDTNDLDKALITAMFVQNGSSANEFKTIEVNSSLKEHGIKLTNPSASLKRLIEKKYLFQTRKDGKLIYMRVSTDGKDHLESLKLSKDD